MRFADFFKNENAGWYGKGDCTIINMVKCQQCKKYHRIEDVHTHELGYVCEDCLGEHLKPADIII